MDISRYVSASDSVAACTRECTSATLPDRPVCVCVCVSEFQQLKGAYKEMIFKPAVLTWKCLHDAAPRHLAHRPLCAGGVYGRSSPVSLCSLRGPPGALDSDVYWPAQLCRVWLHDLESTTNGPPITRTVARFIQAPAQDPLCLFQH